MTDQLIPNVHRLVRVRTVELAGTRPVAVCPDIMICIVRMRQMNVSAPHVSMEEHAKTTLATTGVNVDKVGCPSSLTSECERYYWFCGKVAGTVNTIVLFAFNLIYSIRKR